MDKCAVFIKNWQMQCCGNPFSVGDSVEWLAEKCDEPWTYHKDVETVDYYYEHHSAGWEKLFKISGRVIKITACYSFIVPDPTDPTGRCGIITAGGVTQPVTIGDGWDEDIGEQEFHAYVVCLEEARIAPAKKSEVTFN